MHGIPRHHRQQPCEDCGDGEDPKEYGLVGTKWHKVIADCQLPIADLKSFPITNSQLPLGSILL